MVDDLRLNFKSLPIVVFLAVASCALAVSRLSLRAEENQNSSGSGSATNQVANAKPSHFTCECRFLRVPRDVLRDLFGDTPLGRVNLVKEESLRRLGDLERLQRVTIGTQLKLTTISGAQAQVRSVREVVYPTEYDEESKTVGGFKTREVGGLLNLTPSVGPDGKTINVTIIPEYCYLAKPEQTVEVDLGAGGKVSLLTPNPQFISKNLTTSFVMQSGTTLLLATFDPTEDEGSNAKDFIWLCIFTGAVVDADQIEAPAPE